MKKLLIMFATLALAVVSAASKDYHVTLTQNAWVGGNELKAGDYKIQMDGDKAIIKSGKKVVEVPAKVENAEHRFYSTEVQINSASSKPSIDVICVGGTTMKIVFANATPVE